MWIGELILHHYRSYARASFSLEKGLNLIVGPNGAGKTNILEAIHLLGRGGSFRTPEFRDLIHKEAEEGSVRATLHSKLGSLDVEAQVSSLRKTFLKSQKRTRYTHLGVAAVLFSPESVLLLKEGPSGRRDYLDAMVVATGEGEVVRQYHRALVQRNRLLKQIEVMGRRAIEGQLEVWDLPLAEWGSRLVMARQRVLARLNEAIPAAYAKMAGVPVSAVWAYAPLCGPDLLREGGESVKGWILETLRRRRDDECIRQISLVGPHRDDVVATLGGEPLKGFGSQGEHRSFVLAIKLAEIALLEATLGERPIFLLDDVGSELDRNRNRAFFNEVAGYDGQVIVTATDSALINLDREARVIAL